MTKNYWSNKSAKELYEENSPSFCNDGGIRFSEKNGLKLIQHLLKKHKPYVYGNHEKIVWISKSRRTCLRIRRHNDENNIFVIEGVPTIHSMELIRYF